MTDLFTVSIDTVEGPTLHGRVHLINPDAWQVPNKATFPLALLVDAWFLLTNGFLRDDDRRVPRGDRCPFSVDRGKEIVAGMRRKDEFAELYTYLFGEHLRVDSAGHLLADDGRTLLEPRRKAADVYELSGGSGHDEISRYVVTERNGEAFTRRAAEVVSTYHCGPVHNVPLWSEVAALEDEDDPWTPGESREEMATWHDPADLEFGRVWSLLASRPFEERPYADITVTVTDAALLAHMAAGMRWSTTHTGLV
ncbi:hypothetical protein HUT18_20305 [Streptomyces sp. NA04227]|uniref:hypothetical protein n=1 Tax=Streptomyces sp. NA04227 TaxID=2742136 RepID=UPI0015907851|nr:hypothetical protein [Streptomyces sp. NA04227]QKW08365.1 hypothetical protein HUT18_20305 [Streptomyces sp. NA04227]